VASYSGDDVFLFRVRAPDPYSASPLSVCGPLPSEVTPPTKPMATAATEVTEESTDSLKRRVRLLCCHCASLLPVWPAPGRVEEGEQLRVVAMELLSERQWTAASLALKQVLVNTCAAR
jgi:hypothetical protein